MAPALFNTAALTEAASSQRSGEISRMAGIAAQSELPKSNFG